METAAVLNGSFGKQFVRYVSFNVFSMMGLSLYILADTFFVANGVGPDGLTALNLVIPLYNLINGLGLMLGMGGATCYSILRGQGEEGQANKVFTLSVLAALFIGLLLLCMYPFAYPFAELLGGTGLVRDYAGQYLEVNFLFAPAYLLNNVLVCFVRNDGAPNLSMASMLLGSASNIVLDYVFVFPLGMGMFGAALATGFAPVWGILLLSTRLLRRRGALRLSFRRLSLKPFGRCLALGLPSLLSELSSGMVILVFNFVILSVAGNLGVAAYGIIANIALIAIAVFTGIAQGIQPLISAYSGAGRLRDARRTLRTACLLALLLGVLFWGAGLLFPDGIAAAFNRDGDPALAALAQDGIRIYFSGFLFAGVNIAAISCFASSGRAGPSLLLSLCRGFLFVLAALGILAPAFGLTGVWWSVPLAETAACLLSIPLLLRFGRAGQQTPSR